MSEKAFKIFNKNSPLQYNDVIPDLIRNPEHGHKVTHHHTRKSAQKLISVHMPIKCVYECVIIEPVFQTLYRNL